MLHATSLPTKYKGHPENRDGLCLFGRLWGQYGGTVIPSFTQMAGSLHIPSEIFGNDAKNSW
jgi:hypothetical protein